MRREFTTKIKVQAFADANGHCESCSVRLSTGKFHFDHRIPDGMGGGPTLDNCRVLCVACHSEKTTKSDVPAIAKAKRREAKHIGATKPKRPWPKRSFNQQWRHT